MLLRSVSAALLTALRTCCSTSGSSIRGSWWRSSTRTIRLAASDIGIMRSSGLARAASSMMTVSKTTSSSDRTRLASVILRESASGRSSRTRRCRPAASIPPRRDLRAAIPGSPQGRGAPPRRQLAQRLLHLRHGLSRRAVISGSAAGIGVGPAGRSSRSRRGPGGRGAHQGNRVAARRPTPRLGRAFDVTGIGPLGQRLDPAQCLGRGAGAVVGERLGRRAQPAQRRQGQFVRVGQCRGSRCPWPH